MKRTVQDVMTRTVIVVNASAPFKELVGLMDEHRVSALPVVDGEGRLVGIVSEADLLLKEGYTPSGGERHVFEGRRRRIERSKASGLVAAQLMTAPVVTVSPEASLGEAARRMHERRVKRLPVVDAEGRVVGIVSRADLLKVFLRCDEEIRHEVVRDVIERTLWIDPLTIRVEVRDGVVLLQGQVERRSLIPVFVSLVQRVEGVVGVDARLSYEVDDVTGRREAWAPWGLVQSGRRSH